MQEDRSAEKALSWNLEEKRRRGRTRTSWKETVMHDIHYMDTEWEDMLDKTIDREEWR